MGTDKTTNPKPYHILEAHFTRLDIASMKGDTIFRIYQDKERYESLLMFAFRKYKAANYHLENTLAFISEEDKEVQSKGVNLSRAGVRITKASFKIARSADRYVYELSAFLEALKSSIDLIAEVCSCYLQGVTTNYSISPLIKQIEKKKTGPIIDELTENLLWLKSLREYRHYLVHRFVPQIWSGHEIHTVAGITHKSRYPIVIPVKTPSYIPDTRKKRMMLEENLPGLEFSWEEEGITDEEGAEKMVTFSLETSPSSEYISIEDFMYFHIKQYDIFFESVIKAFDNLEFKSIKI